MVVLIQATVLTVGLNSRNKVLRELPIRLITKQSGIEAARSLKNEEVDSIISRWDLDDMEGGRFLKALRAARPDVTTIALVKAGDRAQEIAARSLGVTAVLTDESDEEFFRDTVANALKLKGHISVGAVRN